MGNAPVGRADSSGLAWLLFDGEAWGQLGHDMFIGDIQSTMSPDSYLALRGCYGVEISRFRGPNGEIVSGDEVLLKLLKRAGLDLATLTMARAFGGIGRALGLGARAFAKGSPTAAGGPGAAGSGPWSLGPGPSGIRVGRKSSGRISCY